jgi:hypothetical protein
MENKQCRICYEENEPLIAPCKCDGSIKYVHETCILAWFEHQPDREIRCELCIQPYNVTYMYPFEYVFDLYEADYILYISPFFLTTAIYIVSNSYRTLYITLTKRWIPETYDHYVTLQYTSICIWFAAFFTRARIQNWDLYWKHYRCVTYLNFLVIYAFTVGMISSNGFYSAAVANILQPFFFYIHNRIAAQINRENRLRIMG